MSTDHNTPGQVMPALRRMSEKYDSLSTQMDDFAYRQASGQNPDGAEFLKLVEQRMTTNQAMQAQMKLHEKPLKTVLTDSR